MKRVLATSSVVALVVLGGASAASAADHGSCTDSNKKFCAFDGSNYETQLTSFLPQSGYTYSVTDNKTTSVANHNTSFSVCGVESSGWPDQTVLTVGPTQSISSLGSSSNNKIDHFYTC